jgi:hypothetical protein
MAATAYSSLITSTRRHLNEIYTLIAPGTPLVSPQGTTGATTYTYRIVANNATGTSEAGVAGTTTTGNATLSGTNFNRVTWIAVPYVSSYDVYRTAGGATQGIISNDTTAVTLDDTGLAGGSETAPATNTSGVTQAFWTDAELLDIAVKGTSDLWAAILDLHQEHFLTVDVTNVSLAADTATLTGIPTDTFRVHLIEPRDTTTATSGYNTIFVPRDYNHPDFVYARSQTAVSPTNGPIIYYAITGAGGPVGTPTVRVAPQLNSALNLRFVYVQVPAFTTFAATTDNPIPGESNNAIIAWMVAYARAKEREDRNPDPGWIAIYATEKQSLLTRLTPRQTQEPDYVEGLFEYYL